MIFGWFLQCKCLTILDLLKTEIWRNCTLCVVLLATTSETLTGEASNFDYVLTIILSRTALETFALLSLIVYVC